jgi:hypothetical protein
MIRTRKRPTVTETPEITARLEACRNGCTCGAWLDLSGHNPRTCPACPPFSRECVNHHSAHIVRGQDGNACAICGPLPADRVTDEGRA